MRRNRRTSKLQPVKFKDKNMRKTFESFLDYLKFELLVKRTNRYRYYQWGEDFLDTLIATSESRKTLIPKDEILWRSQLGMAEPRQVIGEEVVYDDTNPLPFPPERMKPRFGIAPEGRVNPKGISYLYLSTDPETAMAECRPWLNSKISLGKFITTQELSIVDFLKDVYTPVSIMDIEKEKNDKHFVEMVIWGQINKAFTEPLSNSNFEADYTPTQVIAELFKNKGFDGIKYKSALGSGHNIALFDLNHTELTHCYLYNTEGISYSFEGVENISYATPLGEYLDDPNAAKEFLEHIEKVTRGLSKKKNIDQNNGKTYQDIQPDSKKSGPSEI